MYRACSTWQYDVSCKLVESKLGGRRLGFLDGDGFARARTLSRSAPSTEVLKSHDAHHAFVESLARGESLAVYAYRDLRDVAYSYMHKAVARFPSPS